MDENRKRLNVEEYKKDVTVLRLSERREKRNKSRLMREFDYLLGGDDCVAPGWDEKVLLWTEELGGTEKKISLVGQEEVQSFSGNGNSQTKQWKGGLHSLKTELKWKPDH